MRKNENHIRCNGWRQRTRRKYKRSNKSNKKIKAEIVLVGKEEIIRNKIKEFYGKEIEEISDRLKIKNATETIEMEDQPTVAIKHKKTHQW